jgi:signal transduction histidine kinase
VATVRDNGAGIPPDLLSSVFDMFAQGADAASGSQQGLGVGLALARALVEMHEGRIEAHSEGAGKGAEFVVRLPAA